MCDTETKVSSETEVTSETEKKTELPAPKKLIHELCLAGAANRGIAYIGAIKCLQDNCVLDVKKFVGVSIGSLVGVAFILKYDMDLLFEDILLQDISEFQDISISSAITQWSVLRGEKYKIWVWELLSKKIDPMTNFKTI